MIRLYHLNSGLFFFLAGIFGSAMIDLVLTVQLQPIGKERRWVLLIASVLWGFAAGLWAISGMYLNEAHRKVERQFKPVFDETEQKDIYKDVFSSRRRRIMSFVLGALLLSIGGQLVLIVF